MGRAVTCDLFRVNIAKLLSRKLYKGLLMFPEDFPTMLAAADILKEAGCDVCGRFPLAFYEPSSCSEKLSFFPWVCRTSFSGMPGPEAEAYPKGGAGEGSSLSCLYFYVKTVKYNLFMMI